MSELPLPLPDYDHLPIGSLQHRIRSLSGAELQRLLEYEQAHNDRPQVVETLRNRLAELAEGEAPSPGSQDEEPLETHETRHGSPVSPGGAAEPIHPPRHGVAGFHGKKGNRP